ncbi:MAG: hypothetical protein LBN23_08485, partial [Paludibacter sp.]|nr:hypothetical protein [Paludibacter sp.]
DLKRIFGEIIPLFKDKHLSIYANGHNGGFIRYTNCEQDVSGVRPPFYARYDLLDSPYYLESDYRRRFGYIYVSTFSYGILETLESKYHNIRNPERQLDTLECTNGLIIDLRDNTGGSLLSLYNFVASFYFEKKTLLFQQDKTGYGHNDFSTKTPVIIEGKGYVDDGVPIVILTSIYTYSAANYAVYMLKDIRKCTVIGEATSGGGGGRLDVILPNGWKLSYPCNKTFSASGKNMEYPFEPDIYVKNYPAVVYGEGLEDTIFMKALESLENLQRNK